ncbi:MAG: ribonucleoside-diphosphate reductase [Acetobacteraceae bacterium]|jgi:adenosylcobalamin-dependent ribonucleoside-triphosphate reductase|nr:ribonucleoside-diphosphate reductase [Acetobacteraceae bacterium]
MTLIQPVPPSLLSQPLLPWGETPARTYAPGMGQAVADRTINRRIVRRFPAGQRVPFAVPRDDSSSLESQLAAWARREGWAYEGVFHVEHGDDVSVSGWIMAVGRIETESWADVAERVALGNALLEPRAEWREAERATLRHHLRQASLLMSGRHLQHGDASQPQRNMEVFTNCSTAATSFLCYLLLLNGSGVGRAYDDAMMAVDWARDMPLVVPVIDWSHADVQAGTITGFLTRRDAEHLYGTHGRIVVHEVGDSREGWAKAVELVERLTFEKRRDDVVLLDFTKVRPKGAPIMGMQGRPASGPGPYMQALARVAMVRGSGMEPWRAALFVDHYLAECVLVGGARRSARMSTKTWRDRSVLGFISVKRGGFLWSSNNSITVDADFWAHVRRTEPDAAWDEATREEWAHAHAVFEAAVRAAYDDGTGEPGFINQDKLVSNSEGLDAYASGTLFMGSAKYQADDETRALLGDLVSRARASRYTQITNPCGEISLFMLGGYCVIADVVPYHAADDDDAEAAFRAAARALIRVNQMDCLYRPETQRTNRIGVGITGLHEYALKRFGYGWAELVDEAKSKPFWMMLARFKRAVADEASRYSAALGVARPHTDTTMKPAGTTSKLFGLTEGAHLPSMREYLRWVQFRNDDPMVKEYRAKGYPVRNLTTYRGTTVVGFPTKPEIVRLADELGLTDKLVTAGEATPEEQYRYLQLLEKYWIRGVDEAGEPLAQDTGNQVSYTLKYDPTTVSYEGFRAAIMQLQPTVRACSVMPQTDTTAYEYQPEQAVTKAEYEMIAAAIAEAAAEDVGREHVDCAGGVCPIDFGTNDASAAKDGAKQEAQAAA